MKTHVFGNGLTIKTCGTDNSYVKMAHPDGRYYEGGYDNATGDFKGVGKYLHGNGDIYHG